MSAIQKKFGVCTWGIPLLLRCLILFPFADAVAAPKAAPKKDDAKEKKVEIKKTDETTVQFSYDGRDETPPGAPDPNFPSIDKIFKNPALQSGLASGADAVNHSIESLMESVFYSLLDNKLVYNFSDYVYANINLTRDVYSTTFGEYVVADRAGFGPGYTQELGRVHNIPVTFGSEGGVEVLDIYLTTDGKRVAEQEDLPFWRRTVNNWFGVLPILSAILPPSFNPNELYDPLHQLETPFIFPKSIDAFKRMPLGTIRSYGISGGVHVGIDLGSGIIDRKIRRSLEDLKGLDATLPYSVFKTGEHRINVLKRGENLAWVGLTDMKRTGHSLTPLVGTQLFFLTGTIPYWKGFKVNMFPLDIEFSQALVDRFDQLYAYDLTNPKAQAAYLDAIKGDFTSSMLMTEMEKKEGVKAGVLYLFTRNQDSLESGTRSAKNLAAFRVQRDQTRSVSESKITDSKGTYYVLESNQDTNDEWWNILVGSNEQKLHQDALLSVQKVVDPANGTGAVERYVFSETANPIGITISITLQDKYLTTGDLESIINRLKRFTQLPLDDLPTFERIAPERRKNYEAAGYFASPESQTFLIHPMDQHLGDFSAVASVFVSTSALEEILRMDEHEWWEAFAKAFDQDDPQRWGDKGRGKDFGLQARWLPSTLLFPLRLLNVRSPSIDAIREITGRIDGLKRLRKSLDPIEARNSLHKFFDSDYADLTVQALLNMIDAERLPRSIQFYAKAKGNAADEVKDRFNQINGRVIKSKAQFPALERYGWLKERLGEFSPASVKERRNRPAITKILVDSVDAEASVQPVVEKRVRIRLFAKNLAPDTPTRIFARIEQLGRMSLGKLVLAENVFRLEPMPQEGAGKQPLDVQEFEFFLNGKGSPLEGFVYDRALASGGDFGVSLSVSSDGVVFSNERQFQFRLEDGKLGKPLN